MDYINPFGYNFGIGQYPGIGQYAGATTPVAQTLGVQAPGQVGGYPTQAGPLDLFQSGYNLLGQNLSGLGLQNSPLGLTGGLPGVSNQLMGGGQVVAQLIAADSAMGVDSLVMSGMSELMGGVGGSAASMFGDPWTQAMGLMQSLGWSQSLSGMNQQLTTQMQETQGIQGLLGQLFGLPSSTNYQGAQGYSGLQGLQGMLPYIRQTPPLIFDLDGSGKPDVYNGEWKNHLIQPGFQNAPKVYFDVNGDGRKEVTEWFGPKDGILLVDNDDAIATGKREATGKDFYGDPLGYEDGYLKLQTVDADKNGKLAGDELKGLKIWQDQNQDARVDNGELKTMQELGITEINTAHKDYESTYLQNGEVKKTWNWWPTYWG